MTPAQCGTWPLSRSQFPVTLHTSPAPPPPPPIHPQILWLQLLPSLPSPPARSPLSLKSFLPYSFPHLFPLQSAHSPAPSQISSPVCANPICGPLHAPKLLPDHTAFCPPLPHSTPGSPAPRFPTRQEYPPGTCLTCPLPLGLSQTPPPCRSLPNHLLQDHLPGVPTPFTLIVCFFWQHELQAGRGLLSCSPLSPAMQTLSIQQQGQEVSAPRILGSPSAFSFAPADIFNKK